MKMEEKKTASQQEKFWKESIIYLCADLYSLEPYCLAGLTE